jgi:hypothetical protein
MLVSGQKKKHVHILIRRELARKLGPVIMFLLCIRKVSVSNLDWDYTDSGFLFVVCFGPFRQMSPQFLNRTASASLEIIPNSSVLYHPIIELYILCSTDRA